MPDPATHAYAEARPCRSSQSYAASGFTEDDRMGLRSDLVDEMTDIMAACDSMRRSARHLYEEQMAMIERQERSARADWRSRARAARTASRQAEAAEVDVGGLASPGESGPAARRPVHGYHHIRSGPHAGTSVRLISMPVEGAYFYAKEP